MSMAKSKVIVITTAQCSGGHDLDVLISIHTWWRHQMETFSVLLAICVVNSPVTGEFPTQRPVTQSFDVFFDLCLNRGLSKQSWGWWFEMPSRLLNNDITVMIKTCQENCARLCITEQYILVNNMIVETRQHSTQSVGNMPPPSPRHLLPHVLQIMPKNPKYDQFQPTGHHNEENPQSTTKMPGNPKFYPFH